MLFNSYTFIFGFLPFALLVYHALRYANCVRASIIALTLLSLFFYGWWNPKYLLLLVFLTLANFAAAKLIIYNRHSPSSAKAVLIAGLTMNLAVLGYFKYTNFLIDNLNAFAGAHFHVAHIVLPLGISFFTFQKIAFLVDAYRGKVNDLNLVDFALFVSFFPQLIAGPIVHHSEVLPQFRRAKDVFASDVALGLTIFTIGLAKKVLLADTAALYATPGFDAAASEMLDSAHAWLAALAYTAQLYFDFSGYSDMAIGAALLFGIRLPVNFNSPYKAVSIIDFWRRWHITLSRFLRDYLYIPLGGNRHGKLRRYINLLITMLLGGFWHGANWTFMIWGGLHGIYLIINHAWAHLRARPAGRGEIMLGRAITFLAVTVAWVFFRAADIPTALHMLKAMSGSAGWAGAPMGDAFLVIGSILALTFTAPNTQELTGYSGPAGAYDECLAPHPSSRWRWRATPRWALAIGCLGVLAIASLSRVSEFIYFQF